MPRAKMTHTDEVLEPELPFSLPSADELNEVPEPDTHEDGPDFEESDEEDFGLDADEQDSIQVEDMDPKAPLWEDGPTAGQTVEWKRHFGEVFVSSFDLDKHYMWRTLNRNEYKQIVRQVEKLVSSGQMSQVDANMYNEEIITEVCLLHPKLTRQDFNSNLAGLPSIISQQVLESSGFNTIDVRKL